MTTTIRKELPLLVIVLLPFIYLASIWHQLPEQVPLHWNLEGEIDRYGNKIELILIPILLPLLIYSIFLIIPKIDPKNKLTKMGNKYQSIKIILTSFMSVLALFILYSVKKQSITNPNFIIISLGVLFIILGNFFKTIKPNYFLGIRTPWTLESETVWKETHIMAGKLWFIGGVIIIFSSLILNSETNSIVFFTITGIITIVPIIYSYLQFNKKQKTAP